MPARAARGAPVRKPAAAGARPQTAPAPPRERLAAPKAELGLTIDLTFHFSAKHPTRKGDITIKGSRDWKDIQPKDYLKAFLHKVNECCNLCDFESPMKDAKAKATKVQLLKHLNDCFARPEIVGVLTPEAMRAMYEMIAVNLFRSLPVNPIRGPLDANDSVIDDAMPHLSLVYQLVLASFICPHTADCLTRKFLYGVIGNGASLDDNERQLVKELLTKVYQRFMSLRPLIRNFMGSRFAIGDCSSDLLEFFSSVINGFNAPLKPEHVNLFRHSFNRLHSHFELYRFHEQMIECVSKMITKQPELLSEVLKYLYQHWPRAERRKQYTYLKELEYLLVNHLKQFNEENVVVAFRTLNCALYNDFSELCDQANRILTLSKVIDVIMKFQAIVYPIVFENIVKAARNHWDECVRANTLVTLQALQSINPELFKKMNDGRAGLRKTRTLQISSFQTNWLTMLDFAKANDPGIGNLVFGATSRF
jgi:serine/threonine-protein phosphatase 2A regulatory subunit B'